MAAFKIKEEEAIAVFSEPSFPATYLTCAFFKRLDLAVSNKVVTTKKKAHTPIWGFVKPRINIMKFTNPKKVSVNRWRNVKKAERIQYDEKYFFKGNSLN